ncbi:MAG: hypothetical protein HYZ91_06250 [Candidatus Omnitrophica bacterium]|nr:hypothetical protein [Candidatus Omnitrophota bacterium]
MRPHRWRWWLLGIALISPSAFAGSIDTNSLAAPWPKQRVRDLEVGRYDVRWRDRLSKRDGVWAGAHFTAPLARQRVWDLATDYHEIGKKTPGVTAVRVVEESADRQVIQLDVKVLWKTLTLTFEVEQDPPKALRFRLVHPALGEYRGVCLFEETRDVERQGFPHRATPVALSTWLKPSRPVPLGLLLVVERMALLQGIKGFLEACDRQATAVPHPSTAPFRFHARAASTTARLR